MMTPTHRHAASQRYRASQSLAGALLLASTAATGSPVSYRSMTYDVVVYAGNPGGIGAAIAAADGGRNSVGLFEPLTMIGGMGAAGGVGLMNQGAGLAGVTGLGRVWGLLNGAHYGNASKLNVFPEPRVGATSFWSMVNSTSSIDAHLGCFLVDVAMDAPSACVTSVTFSCEADTVMITASASVFIDASYDGDIMVGTGTVDFTYGREPSSEFNESLAGVLLLDEQKESFDKQNLTVDAYNPDGSLRYGITPVPLAPAGSGDDALMAFSFFACVTTDARNLIPFSMPAGYNPDDFALLQAQIDGVIANGRFPLGPDLSYFSDNTEYDTFPNNSKVMLCCGEAPVDCDEPGLNHGWAAGNRTTRAAIAAAHEYYLLGSLYYMANDPRVPPYTRNATGRWGLCADEYTMNNNWPPQIYVRISNRLRGEVLLTQNNIANPRSKPDGVSMACWTFDQHIVTRHAVPDPHNASHMIALNEGFMLNDIGTGKPCGTPGVVCNDDVAGSNWYDVPFGVMLPQRGQANNLLIPVAISSTSVAYSSTRIEGMYMDLGTAAGVAAALALNASSPAPGACPSMALQDTNVTVVQDILVSKYQQRIHGPINTTLDGRPL